MSHFFVLAVVIAAGADRLSIEPRHYGCASLSFASVACLVLFYHGKIIPIPPKALPLDDLLAFEISS
jgi:hypothetical protein